MNKHEAITVRIGRGNVNHPARIVDGYKVLACGCPNTANGHGALAAQTIAFGWAAVNCKRGDVFRQAAEDQATDAAWVALEWNPANDFRPASEGGLIVRKRK
jgi:hypothetical protein